MKVGPLYHAFKRDGSILPRLIHTGQHYDSLMSSIVVDQLGLVPDFSLNVGSGTHAEQTGRVMMAYEKVCIEDRPDWVIVVGDVNSTLACALTAAKLNIPVAHLEAGLRSGDRTMPEEINRIVTDAVSSLLWTPSPDADINLQKEGVAGKIEFVGNIMIDAYEFLREKIHEVPRYCAEDYAVVTLHRPSNVDDPVVLRKIQERLMEISRETAIIFPVHPRTRSKLDVEYSLGFPIIYVEPLDYIRFMSLVENARFVVTDSGGLQEETTYLGIPCFTLRENTERPITVRQGTNRLVNIDNIMESINSKIDRYVMPEFWDGKAAGRVVESLKRASGLF